MTENEMAEWHHQLNGHEFQQALGDGEGQGRLACCSPWGCKESDTTEQLNNTDLNTKLNQLTFYKELQEIIFLTFGRVRACSVASVVSDSV